MELVREEFEKTRLTNDKELIVKVAKLGQTKKAMPFIQDLKRRLVQAKETPETVFDRQLAFNEVEVLTEMVAGLRRTTGCQIVEVVSVSGDGKTGHVILGEDVNKTRDGLPPVAEMSKPGSPSFLFENLAD